MKLNFLVPIIFALAVSCGGSGRNNPNNRPDDFRKVLDMNSQTAQSTRHDTVDFGRVRQGETVGYKLGLRNADSTAMVILEVLNSCGCTYLEFDKQPVLPGDTATLQLFFDSNGQFGSQYKLIQVITSFDQRPHNVYVLAEVYK